MTNINPINLKPSKAKPMLSISLKIKVSLFIFMFHSCSVSAKEPIDAAIEGGEKGAAISIIIGLAFILVTIIAVIWKKAANWWGRKIETPNNFKANVNVSSTYVPLTISNNHAVSPIQNVQELTSNDELYAKALNEVNSGQQQSGLWAKCLVEADGDKDKATARFIKYRVAQLSEKSILNSTQPSYADALNIINRNTTIQETVPASELIYQSAMDAYTGKNGTEKRNLENALALAKRAAAFEHPDAMYLIGWLYENGEGVSKSLSEAGLWYGKATQAGSTKALRRISKAYLNGEIGFEKNHKISLIYEDAANNPTKILDLTKRVANTLNEGNGKATWIIMIAIISLMFALLGGKKPEATEAPVVEAPTPATPEVEPVHEVATTAVPNEVKQITPDSVIQTTSRTSKAIEQVVPSPITQTIQESTDANSDKNIISNGALDANTLTPIPTGTQFTGSAISNIQDPHASLLDTHIQNATNNYNLAKSMLQHAINPTQAYADLQQATQQLINAQDAKTDSLYVTLGNAGALGNINAISHLAYLYSQFAGQQMGFAELKNGEIVIATRDGNVVTRGTPATVSTFLLKGLQWTPSSRQ